MVAILAQALLVAHGSLQVINRGIQCRQNELARLFETVTYTVTSEKADRVQGVLASVFNYLSSGKVNIDTSQEVSSIYNLVTPHEETLQAVQDAIQKRHSNGVPLTGTDVDIYKPLRPDEIRYYTLDAGALDGFERELLELGAQGFNRWLVYGAGGRPKKPMWMWNITWKKSPTVKTEEIVRLYHRYFHRSQGIFIEQIQVRGDELVLEGAPVQV